ncbi:MAG TPA: RNA-binding protein [Hyphomicrobiaceae bacterium]|nr:RNA-binding protein [Hyphomicrobiaceae bacterium]
MASAEDRQVPPDATHGSPLRLCAVTRTHKGADDLIRFVLAPDGSIVPDLARRLPGRGVWVGATRQDVAAALRQKAFARSLKRSVLVPNDLVERVESLLKRRLADAISLARKAGLLVAGFAKVEELIGLGQAVVLVHAADAAGDGVAKLDRKFRALRGPGAAAEAIVRELTSAELSLAIGRSNVVHAAASGGGACRRIAYEASRLRRYREGGPEVPTDIGSNTGRV